MLYKEPLTPSFPEPTVPPTILSWGEMCVSQESPRDGVPCP